MTSNITKAESLKYSAIVFLGGACYGAQASIIKFAYAEGFTPGQVAFSEYLCGLILFGLINLFMKIKNGKLDKVPLKTALKLMGMGLVTAGTAVFYFGSLNMLEASVAITLLFQFTWVGVVIQVITTKKAPRITTIIAVIAILIGTFFASGIYKTPIEEMNILGVIFGLTSALFCALFMHLSGTVATELPAYRRSLYIALGATLITFFTAPDFFTREVLTNGIVKYGLILGVAGFIGPVFLFAYAAPFLPTGISTIMASSELPISVFFSVTLLGEFVTHAQIVGITIILIGVVISQLAKPDPTRRSSPG